MSIERADTVHKGPVLGDSNKLWSPLPPPARRADNDFPYSEKLANVPVDLKRSLVLNVQHVDDQIDVLLMGSNLGSLFNGDYQLFDITGHLHILSKKKAIPAELDLVVRTTDYGPGGDNWWTCGFYLAYLDEPTKVLDVQNWTYHRVGQDNRHASVEYTIPLML